MRVLIQRAILRAIQDSAPFRMRANLVQNSPHSRRSILRAQSSARYRRAAASEIFSCTDRPSRFRGLVMPRIIVERNIEVPMRDGCVLRADLFRPDTPEKLPVLLNRTPYNKAMPMVYGGTLDALRAAEAGYNVMVQDCRGRFASAGVWNCFTDEARDGYDTIEWAARQTLGRRQSRHLRRVVHGRDAMARRDQRAAEPQRRWRRRSLPATITTDGLTRAAPSRCSST